MIAGLMILNCTYFFHEIIRKVIQAEEYKLDIIAFCVSLIIVNSINKKSYKWLLIRAAGSIMLLSIYIPDMIKNLREYIIFIVIISIILTYTYTQLKPHFKEAPASI